jgi:dCMP deaminase
MNEKWVSMYFDIALRVAQESHAVRLKVGAVFVSPDGVMSIGINGLPAGGDNVCEYKDVDAIGDIVLKTRPEVSHAEENLFAKLMRQGVSTKDGTVFLTHAPCIQCSKILVGSGIKELYYLSKYRDEDGIKWLLKNNITVTKVDYAPI